MKRRSKAASLVAIRCRVTTVLLLALMSIAWAGSMCSARETGTIQLAGKVPPVMELVVRNSVIQWDGLRPGDNECPTSAAFSVISNVPFKVTIMSDNPNMQATEAGPLHGTTLSHPLEWSSDSSCCYTPVSTSPQTVIYGEYHSELVLHTLEFRQKIDITDPPTIESNEYYRGTVILSLEAAS
ncbi:MAG TPA: hypothetical protein PLK04_07915 [Bacillota bacterium]|nr:hypothetical protein [Bacillota bacterium]HOB42166.1 hypothetical protein [Bacillota bacterium]HOK71852.1 hypothetical protein [Bacillota bacterium]HOL52061.1 hypothetical protein [Bacillota bacterium]HPQ03041.1 hypothetical protein [Bacillota bacterium]